MTVIDSHCHIWGRGFLPPAFFRRAAEGWAAKEAGRTPDMILPRLLDGVVDETGDDFIANMDRAGVDAAFVMMIDVGAPLFGEEPRVRVEAQIEYYAALQRRHPGRLYCHVSVDHRRPECIAIVRRALRELKLLGIGEITPDGFTVADDDLKPLMRLAAEAGAPVQVHTRAGIWTDFAGSDQTERNTAHPVHVARLARALPDLKLVLCHAGFPNWWQAAAEVIADLPNCVLDISNWNERLHEPWEVVARLATWRSIVGAERILFASDQPSGKRFTGERSELGAWADLFRNLPAVAAAAGYRFTADEAVGILGANAARFYRLA
jgi:predicted TIM-barrel fold metal-dependent hydrolase